MSVATFEPIPFWSARLSCVLLTVLGLLPAQAETDALPRIEVFARADTPVTGLQALATESGHEGPRVHIYVLDGLQALEAQFSENLARDPSQARRQALERIYRLNKTDRARLQRAAVGLARAVHYGIDRYPAMVFDGQLVVYGLTDLGAALAHYRRWHRP
ncbi:MAG: TIGR03757 family integrating conjugative element protein [Proteobacteria bacterium]|nr:TIGR03757 family integrating conjugative element protein [Pseudomonadota bacterium]